MLRYDKTIQRYFFVQESHNINNKMYIFIKYDNFIAD